MALPVRRHRDTLDEAPPTFGPLAELDRLHHELARFLDSWRKLPEFVGGFNPLADVEETTDAYVVEVEVPCVRREDIDIEIVGRRLTITGERKEKERVGILRRRERTVGRFACEVVLPGDVEEGGIEAHLEGGVLSVRLPKPERDRSRRIEIH